MMPSRQPLLLVFVLFSCAVPGLAQTCTVCKDRSPITAPDKTFNVPGLPINDCATLEATAAVFPEDDVACTDTIHAVGTMCGCPIPEGACRLCPDGSTAPNKDVLLTDFLVGDFIPNDSVAGATPTCSLLESILHNYNENDGQCLDIRQTDTAETCGCPMPDSGEGGDGDDQTATNTTLAPSLSPAPSVKRFEACSMCVGGGDILYPEKPINLTEDGGFLVETCSDLVDFATIVAAGSDGCISFQTFGPMCGCPIDREAEHSCSICADNEPVPYLDKGMSWVASFSFGLPNIIDGVGDALTCEMMESMFLVPSEETTLHRPKDFMCMAVQLRSANCGCAPDKRQKALLWTNRVAGILSLMVSVLRRVVL